VDGNAVITIAATLAWLVGRTDRKRLYPIWRHRNTGLRGAEYSAI
jgi:hypothetical protein